jgi:hypothetical protein
MARPLFLSQNDKKIVSVRKMLRQGARAGKEVKQDKALEKTRF